MQLRFKEWYLVDAQAHGTSHGSPYSYDTDVPLLFLGAGVGAGMHERPVGIVDLAPTLTALLGIVPPRDVEDGRTRIECCFEDETLWFTQALAPP